MKSVSPKKSAEKRRIVKLRGALFVRDNGCCVVCGRPLSHGSWHAHHRVLEGQGGKAEMCNLICTDNICHLYVIHGPERAKAEENGWIVRSCFDPAAVPVLYADGRTVLLTNDLEAANG
jgi:hypothetical protein